MQGRQTNCQGWGVDLDEERKKKKNKHSKDETTVNLAHGSFFLELTDPGVDAARKTRLS